MNALPLHDIKGRMNLAVECGRELVSVGVLLKELIASSDQSERALIDGVCEKRILPIIKQAFEDRE
jgi:diaminopimelate decarboxylase